MTSEVVRDERARMGRISGGLWILGALIGIVGTFLPGASHEGLPWVLGLSAIVLAYGIGSVTGLIPWQDATVRQLGIGMVATIPIVVVAIYLTGGSISYVEPLLICSLLYAALFFPPRWAWPLAIELVVAAGAPLLYDGSAIENAFAPRYFALSLGFLAVTGVMINLKRDLLEAERRQRVIANRDPLTDVANRRAFDQALRRELAARGGLASRRESDNEPLALMIIDVDDFKAINDDHGHGVGDVVLRQTAARAASVLRSTDMLARIGGDEFAVIAPGSRGENAARMAEALSHAIAAHEPGSSTPAPRVSVGHASYPDDGTTYEELMTSADQRLLRLKAAARIAPRGRETTLRLL
jgi:diguanylate cyclase (GGDEF)-like protein